MRAWTGPKNGFSCGTRVFLYGETGELRAEEERKGGGTYRSSREVESMALKGMPWLQGYHHIDIAIIYCKFREVTTPKRARAVQVY